MAVPPETARMLDALEAFLDAPPLRCDFRCIRCHNHVASDYNLVQDLYPFSMAKLLFDPDVPGVMPGAYSPPVRGLYVGEHPEGSHVDAVSVYCSSCGSWLGRRIIRLYVDHHPVIRQGQFVLVCGGAGIEPVFPVQNFL
ncbi:uncharacterized protein LOC117932366 [Vitis riparia]|uniref:uncharacterized protein LOC117932366 n=1 Tax=Vitis riparia TaxID=96939 RepID=UPI00155B028E|nr:uncharacterized protein LOC117932366 [Vitis riparia]XP_034709487.1 uncharacterized protein LOC117932366 [Vitis riparia]